MSSQPGAVRLYIKENHKKQSADEMCDALMKKGFTKVQVSNAMSKMRSQGYKIGVMANPTHAKTEAPKKETKSRHGVISLKDFIEDNDIVKRVEKAVKNLTKGELMYESAFVNEYVPRRPGYRDALNDPKFDTYHGVAPGGKVVWGHPDDIEKCKQKGILR